MENTVRQCVPRARFCVGDLPDAARYDAWHDSISCIFQTDRSRTMRQTTRFRASVEVTMIGSMLLGETVTVAQAWSRSERLIAQDGMDHYMVQIYLGGEQVCEAGGRTVEMPRGGALVYDLSRPMTARSSNVHNLSLVVPRAAIEGRLTNPDAHHMKVLPFSDPINAMLVDHIRMMNRHAGRLDSRQAGALTDATTSLFAAVLNATNGDEREEVDTSLARLRVDIRERISDPDLSPEDLCRRHGISRYRLYALFAAQGGVATVIREARLRAAMTQLTGPANGVKRVSDIGRACGFASDSDFSRAFRRRYGMSPSAARHYGLQARAGIAPPGLDRRYEDWLHGLAH